MSHSYSLNHLHVVFSTKDRQKLIEPAMRPKLWSRLLCCQRSLQHPCRNADPHARVTGYPYLGLPPHPSSSQNGVGFKATRRKTGVPDEPVFGLAGWKPAASHTVIVSERRNLPGVERSKMRSCPLLTVQWPAAAASALRQLAVPSSSANRPRKPLSLPACRSCTYPA
jgi:hypothetical protein